MQPARFGNPNYPHPSSHPVLNQFQENQEFLVKCRNLRPGICEWSLWRQPPTSHTITHERVHKLYKGTKCVLCDYSPGNITLSSNSQLLVVSQGYLMRLSLRQRSLPTRHSSPHNSHILHEYDCAVLGCVETHWVGIMLRDIAVYPHELYQIVLNQIDRNTTCDKF